MNSNFYWNWSQLKVIHQLNSLERHLKALIALVGDTWAAQPVWFLKTNGLVGSVTRLVILLRKADSALMYCVHVLKLSLCCERIMVASFTVCKTDWLTAVLQRHHFAQTMCILNSEGCNIFKNLTGKVRFLCVAWVLFNHVRKISVGNALVYRVGGCGLVPWSVL